jgi:putative transposase
MSRFARITVPGLPHHVTQRGNRRMAVFAEPGDYRLYIDLMAERCAVHGVACWAYCLMPNHVHLVLVPATEDGLARAVGEANRRYAAFFNARARVTGHLFQGRFASAAMDEDHLMAAVRYLALNPVKAKLAKRAQDWPWSSVPAHLAGRDDGLVAVAPILERAGQRFADLLKLSRQEELALDGFEMKGVIGRPLGSPAFVAELERRLGRTLAPGKRGRKPKISS